MYFKITLLLWLIFSAVVISADDPDTFSFKVSVAVDGKTGASRGSGGFVVGGDHYGRVGILFGSDPANFKIRSVGGVQLPISYSSGLDTGSGLADSTELALDIYLKGRVTKDLNIKTSGTIIQLTRVPHSSPPVYTYSEQKIDYELPSGVEKELTIDTGALNAAVRLTVLAETRGTMAYKVRTERYVTLTSDYSLLNEDTGQYESKNCRCTLGFGLDEKDSQGECRYRKVYHLPEGETLLYLSTFSIDNMVWNDNHSITFDFVANHIYAFNPEDTLAETDGIKANRLSATVYNKAITARDHETVEIEIPIESHSPLPFRGSETIVLSTSVESRDY